MDICLNLTRLFRVSKAHLIDGDQGHLNVRPKWTEVSLQSPFRLGGGRRAGKLAVPPLAVLTIAPEATIVTPLNVSVPGMCLPSLRVDELFDFVR
jgi:hypothetical protein